MFVHYFYSSLNSQFESALAYTQALATHKDQDKTTEVATDLNEKLRELDLTRKDGVVKKLHRFETCSIANLVKDQETTVEEVTSMIPSLIRFPDDQIELAIKIVIEAKERADK